MTGPAAPSSTEARMALALQGTFTALVTRSAPTARSTSTPSRRSASGRSRAASTVWFRAAARASRRPSRTTSTCAWCATWSRSRTSGCP
jgi:hypothetical protein